jgi:DNA-binding NarL/FixJ family response regulator
MHRLRLVLADDHSVVRVGLKALIDAQADMELVGEASDGAEALALAKDTRPDVVVMDLSMPQLDGLEATQQLHKHCPAIRILVLSVHEEAAYLQQSLKAGASGYILKRTAAASLIEAIRTVGNGGVYIDPALSPAVAQSITGDAKALGLTNALSQREDEVLRLVAQGFGNKEIAHQLSVSVKTVETYKARGMRKFGLSSRVDLVRYATIHGWLGPV